MKPVPALSAEALLAETRSVRRLACALAADLHQADDVEQDTWLAALEHAPADGSLGAWLARVAANFARRGHRSRARRAAREERAARGEAQPSAAELVERADLVRTLVGHVLALDEPYRTTILLRYFEELPPRAIAQRERVPVRTVHTRLARGLVQLRERLERAAGGDRTRWLSALLALSETPFRPTLLGILLMKTSTSTLAAIVIGLGLCGALGYGLRERGTTSEPPAESVAALAPERVAPTPRPPSEPRAAERTALAAPASEAGTAAPAAHDLLLRGRVRDPSGAAIAGARVAARSSTHGDFSWSAGDLPEPFAHTESDGDGLFSLDLGSRGACELEVSAAQHGTVRFGRRRPGDFVEVVLARAGSVAGRVVRKGDGAPIVGAEVVARTTENSNYNPVLASAATDALGAFRIEGLAPRDYWLTASAPGTVPTSTFSTVAVRAAETTTHDIELDPGATVRGRVVDAATRAPIADAEVRLGAKSMAQTDADGRFELGGASTGGKAGSRLTARAPGYGLGELSLRADEVQEPVELALARGRAIVGRVVDASGAPIEGARIGAIAAVTGAKPAYDMRSTRSGPDGAFEITDLRSDLRHALLARAEGRAAHALDLPEAELASERFDVGTIVLGRPALLAGRVVDEQGGPWKEAMIELHGANADRSRLSKDRVTGADAYVARRLATSDEQGRFVFGDLGAGEYTLRVRVAGRGEQKEARVALEPGEVREDLELSFARGLSISGRILAPGGEPLAGVFVQVYPEGGSTKLAGSANTATDGAFRIAGLEPGRFTIRTMFSAVSPARVREAVANGWWNGVEAGVSDLELVLPVAVSISGSVLGPDGAPFEGSFVVASSAASGGRPDATARTDASGRYELAVAEGAVVDLTATAADPSSPPGARHTLAGKRERVAAGAEGVEIQLAPR